MLQTARLFGSRFHHVDAGHYGALRLQIRIDVGAVVDQPASGAPLLFAAEKMPSIDGHDVASVSHRLTSEEIAGRYFVKRLGSGDGADLESNQGAQSEWANGPVERGHPSITARSVRAGFVKVNASLIWSIPADC